MLMLILPASVYVFLNLAVIGIKKIDKTLIPLAVNLPCLIFLLIKTCWIKHFQKLMVIYSLSIYRTTLICRPDPARVINMPPVIYVPRKLPGIIRCPVDANPPVTSVKWEKDGYPLRVEKVSLICFFVEIRGKISHNYLIGLAQGSLWLCWKLYFSNIVK